MADIIIHSGKILRYFNKRINYEEIRAKGTEYKLNVEITKMKKLGKGPELNCFNTFLDQYGIRKFDYYFNEKAKPYILNKQICEALINNCTKRKLPFDENVNTLGIYEITTYYDSNPDVNQFFFYCHGSRSNPFNFAYLDKYKKKTPPATDFAEVFPLAKLLQCLRNPNIKVSKLPLEQILGIPGTLTTDVDRTTFALSNWRNLEQLIKKYLLCYNDIVSDDEKIKINSLVNGSLRTLSINPS